MIERESTYQSFENKIIPYLDGSLSKEEFSEFEAFVMTHPEFEEKIKIKQNQVELIRKMIPTAELSLEGKEALESEMRDSIFNLLKERPKNFIDGLRLKLESWRNR